MKRYVILSSVVLMLCLVSGVDARVWYVHPDSSIKKIQAGLDSCRTGDTVLVRSGTYHENIVWPPTQSVKLLSERGPGATIIDGDSLGIVLRIGEILDSTTVVRGFTIMHGYSTDIAGGIEIAMGSPIVTGNVITENRGGVGAGILCSNGSKAIITANTLTRNNAYTTYGGWGGGISVWQASATVAGNIITSNTAFYRGGGVYCIYSCATVANNRIDSNRTMGSGGGAGVFSYFDSSSFRRNTIRANVGIFGAGMWIRNAGPAIDSNTIEGNQDCGIYCLDTCRAVIRYNNISHNRNFGIVNGTSISMVNAENNWWGDSTGPYHPTQNPGGRGDTVSNYVDFIPWSRWPVGIREEENDTRCRIHDTRLRISPNPFRSRVTIMLNGADQAISGSVGSGPGHQQPALNIYDASGRVVKSFNVGSLLVAHRPLLVTWDGCDDRGQRLPAGVYMVRFTSDDYQETEKLVLVR